MFLEKRKLRKCVAGSPTLKTVLKIVFKLEGNATRWKLGSTESKDQF